MDAWLMSLCCILLAFAFFFFIHSKNSIIPVNWPFVRMLPSFLLNTHRLHEWVTECLRECGSTFIFHGPWFTRMEILLTCDPANVRYILGTHFSNFSKGADFLKIFDVFGDALINAEFDVWRFQRKMHQILFSDVEFRHFTAKTSREMVEKRLMPVLENMARWGQAVDFQDVLQRLMFDNACMLVFGTNPGSLSLSSPTVPFSKAMDDVLEALLFRHAVPESWWMFLRWLRIGEEKKMAAAVKTIDGFIYERISKRMEELSESKEKDMHECCDLLTSYINYQIEDEIGITKSAKFLRDYTMNLMLAGKDTMTACLTWYFWLISKNPRVECKVLDELRANFTTMQGGDARKHAVFDTEELNTLVYLHASLSESLRLFPPVPFEYTGVLKQDVLPSGEMVRPRTKIMFSLYSMGRMEGIWGEDCLEFKPERWISEGGTLRYEPSYKFMAFNTGPRTCLGKDIAFTQMKAVAAAVLYNFHVEVVDGHPVEPKVSLILSMKNGLMVRIRERCA